MINDKRISGSCPLEVGIDGAACTLASMDNPQNTNNGPAVEKVAR